MDLAEICRAVDYSLLLAGSLFILRWWAETKGKDRTSRDRRIAFVLIGTSMICALLAILLGQGGGR